MESKSGVIKSIVIKHGMSARGNWTRYGFEMEDGKTYSTFDKEIGDAFKVGQAVLMSGEQDGKYWNMSSMSLIDKKDVEVSPLQNGANVSMTQTDDLLRQILAEMKEWKKKV